ncbi:hypothetical protein RND81_12G063900 [Saponaria officinalis]|uniref:Uncharacterized protein n=2 Tax=Saponaria officinalis TaxID=3572 RepID=A0AAW1H7B4_SAPOF
MTSRKPTPIRAAGQRSIHSTLFFRSTHKCSPSNKECSNVNSQKKKGESNMSLTSFLNHKLHSTSVLPIHKVKEKGLPIPLESNGLDKSNARDELHSFQKNDGGRTGVIEESVFKLFNSSEAKVRKRSSEHLSKLSRLQGDAKMDCRKHLLILGDDPKPKKRAYKQVSYGEEKPGPLYNHYENGTGWWNSEREGVDNDEVGHKEVWEGVGSTTLGGLNWH